MQFMGMFPFFWIVCIEGDNCEEVGSRTHKEENQKSAYEVNTVFLDA